MIDFVTDDHFIYVTGTPYNRKDEIQSTLSGTYTKKGYRFPRNVYAARELVKFFPELRTNTEFIELGKQLAKERVSIQNLKDPEGVNKDAHIEGLRPYQSQDANFLVANGSSLVLNEPRTGKTPTMIKVIAALFKPKTIIITPSSLTYNWQKEIEKWSVGFQTFVYAGTPKQRLKMKEDFRTSNKKRILIISKDTYKRDVGIQEMDFDVAVIDEAHYLRNYKSAQSKSIFGLKAKTKYALTGTPAVKHGVDIFGLLHFIDPKSFPSYWQFADRYWTIEESQWGKNIGQPKTFREQEMLALLDAKSVQRKRASVMQWLPKVNKERIYVKMEPKQLKLYDQMLETFVASEGETEVDTMNKLTQLIRLRQLCLEPRLLGFDKVIGAKTTALLEFAEGNDEPFIVMTTFSSYFKLIKPELEKLGKKVGVIDGSVSQDKKFKTAEAFQNGKYDILLCNIIAAGTGFTLDRADTILFLDKDFNPANNEQAQDRIVPTTKEKNHNINIVSIVIAGSIDERVDDILENKEDLTKLINKREVFA